MSEKLPKCVRIGVVKKIDYDEEEGISLVLFTRNGINAEIMAIVSQGCLLEVGDKVVCNIEPVCENVHILPTEMEEDNAVMSDIVLDMNSSRCSRCSFGVSTTVVREGRCRSYNNRISISDETGS